MEWMLKQLNFSSLVLMVSKTRFTRKALSFLCFLGALWPCFFPVAASASITNDVEYIRDVLSLWNEAGYLRSFSYMWPNGMTIGEYLMVAFGVPPDWSAEGLYSVLSDIRSKSGSVWTTNDINRLLSAVNDARSPWTTNDIVRLLSAVNSVRSPWSSNDVASVRSDVSDLLTWFNSDLQGWSDSNYSPALSVKDYDLVNLLGFVYQTFDMEGDASLRVHDQDAYDVLYSIQSIVGNDIENYLRGIQEAIERSGADISGNLHEIGGLTNILGGVNANIGDLAILLEDRFLPSVTNSEEYARLIHETDLGYEPSGGRSVRSDFRFLHQQLGFDNPTASNSLAGVLARFFDMGLSNSVIASNDFAVAAITNAEVSLTNVVVESERASENIATNSPDFEEHQYTASNPIDSGDNIFDLPERQFSSITPDLPESSDSTIVLYNGNFPIFRPSSQNRSSSLSSSPVRLNISYALRDNDDVSSGINVLRSIMTYVWDWVFLILSVSMLFSFYNSLVAPSNVGSGFGIGGSAME